MAEMTPPRHYSREGVADEVIRLAWRNGTKSSYTPSSINSI